MRKEEEIQIRKLTVHVNDRPINILAPIRVPLPPRPILSPPKPVPLPPKPKTNPLQPITQPDLFYEGALAKMDEIYADIRKNPHLQVSGLRSARTSLKIPLIKRNKDKLKQLLEQCITHNYKNPRLESRTGVIDKLLDSQRLFKFDIGKETRRAESLHPTTSTSEIRSLEQVMLDRLNSHSIRQKKAHHTQPLPTKDLAQLQPSELGHRRLKFN